MSEYFFHTTTIGAFFGGDHKPPGKSFVGPFFGYWAEKQRCSGIDSSNHLYEKVSFLNGQNGESTPASRSASLKNRRISSGNSFGFNSTHSLP